MNFDFNELPMMLLNMKPFSAFFLFIFFLLGMI